MGERELYSDRRSRASKRAIASAAATFERFFHAMEQLCGIFPQCGKIISTLWKTAARRALNPAAPTPSPAR